MLFPLALGCLLLLLRFVPLPPHQGPGPEGTMLEHPLFWGAVVPCGVLGSRPCFLEAFSSTWLQQLWGAPGTGVPRCMIHASCLCCLLTQGPRTGHLRPRDGLQRCLACQPGLHCAAAPVPPSWAPSCLAFAPCNPWHLSGPFLLGLRIAPSLAFHLTPVCPVLSRGPSLPPCFPKGLPVPWSLCGIEPADATSCCSRVNGRGVFWEAFSQKLG